MEGVPRRRQRWPPELDCLFTDEAWASMSEERQRLIMEVDRDDEEEQVRRNAIDRDPDLQRLSRDVRDSDKLQWIPQHLICNVSESQMGPMRYTSCEPMHRCHHIPHPIVQIIDVSVEFYRNNLELMLRDDKMCSHMEVYGLIALRDSLDYSRNYIFHRSRDNAQAIDVNGGYLHLMNPLGVIYAMGCSININLKIKAKEVEKDLSIVDGSLKALGKFDPWSMNHVDEFNDKITFESCVVNKGVEATTELDLMEVPAGGFLVRMHGSTALFKGFYSFIHEHCCDTDGFISSTGKHNKKIVAAMSIKDTLCIDFVEETPSRHFLAFKASKHGNKRQMYWFNNGAVVSVRIYWSTIIELGL